MLSRLGQWVAPDPAFSTNGASASPPPAAVPVYTFVPGSIRDAHGNPMPDTGTSPPPQQKQSNVAAQPPAGTARLDDGGRGGPGPGDDGGGSADGATGERVPDPRPGPEISKVAPRPPVIVPVGAEVTQGSVPSRPKSAEKKKTLSRLGQWVAPDPAFSTNGASASPPPSAVPGDGGGADGATGKRVPDPGPGPEISKVAPDPPVIVPVGTEVTQGSVPSLPKSAEKKKKKRAPAPMASVATRSGPSVEAPERSQNNAVTFREQKSPTDGTARAEAGFGGGFWTRLGNIVAPDHRRPPTAPPSSPTRNLLSGMSSMTLSDGAPPPPPSPAPPVQSPPPRGPPKRSLSDPLGVTPRATEPRPFFTPPPAQAHLTSGNERLRDLVHSACATTSTSFLSPTSVWEGRKALFNIARDARTFNAKRAIRMKKLLKKDPSLASCRATDMAPLVPDSFTPLHAAASGGNVGAALVLLGAYDAARTAALSWEDPAVDLRSNPLGVDITSVDVRGRTALHVAAAAGAGGAGAAQAELVRLLKRTMAERSGVLPVGPNAPVCLGGRTPAASVRGGGGAVGEIERELFSPGDASVCPITPLRGRYGGTPGRGRAGGTGEARGQVAYGFSEMMGWRPEMEDAVCHHHPVPGETDVGLFGVFDGHGGAACSQYLADRLLVEWQGTDEWLSGECSTDVLKRSLKSACAKLEEAMRFALGPTYTSCGSTGVIGLVTPSDVVVANVGDSRAVLVTRDAAGLPAAIPMSVDHTPELTKERERIEGTGMTVGKIEATDGTVHWKIFKDRPASNDCLAMARAFGDFDYKSVPDLPHHKQPVIAEPDVVAHRRGPDDAFLVLACDGVWDVMTNAEVAEFLYGRIEDGTADPERIAAACDDLLRECIVRKSRDNMTVLVVALSEPSLEQEGGGGEEGRRILDFESK